MDVLGNYGSSSDSEESTAEGPPKQATPTPKRPRVSEAMLPPPKLEPTNHQQQMVLLGSQVIDLLSIKQQEALQQQSEKGGDDKPAVLQRLQQISSSSKGAWAEQLRQQHEFHNPHFFESVVESFGFQTAGTNISSCHEEETDDELWRRSVGLSSRSSLAQERDE